MPLLNWLTRDQDVKTAAKVPHRILQEVPELSYGEPSQNLLVQGDNLEALKALLPFYAGQVKCIYIDPPYNTGSAINEYYDDALEHSQWLAILYPRLVLLREFLRNDGIIVVSIDDREGAYLTVIMDEIFGRKNRLNVVSVKMSEASGVKMSHAKRRLPKLKESILIYCGGTRPDLHVTPVPLGKWNDEYKNLIIGLTDGEISELRELMECTEVTDEVIADCNRILSKCSLGSVAAFMKELGLKTKADQEAWKFENAHRIVQAVGSTSVQKLAMDAPMSGGDISAVRSSTGLVYLYKSDFDRESKQPRVQIIFADDALTTHPGDFWFDIKTTGGVGQEGGVLFPNSKKPEQLMRRVIELATVEGDLVLDSFLGSGTTAAVAHKLKRRWIGVEMGEHARSLCYPRLRSVVDGEQSGISPKVNWKGGGGFRFCTLGPTIFDELGRINPEIKFPELARHLWFLETKTPLTSKTVGTIIGTTEKKAFALLYNGILKDRTPNGGNVLTSGTLKIILEDLQKARSGFQGEVVVYAAASRIGPDRLRDEGIIFKQTPYDISARG